jgi:hypothetical protein
MSDLSRRIYSSSAFRNSPCGETNLTIVEYCMAQLNGTAFRNFSSQCIDISQDVLMFVCS